MPQPLPLRDDQFVYVAIRSIAYMDETTSRINPNAFHMRERDFGGDPPHGLSTTVLDHCPSIEEIIKLTGLKSKVCGVDALNVGAVRAIGLEVTRTTQTKALIVGMPYPVDDNDYETAEQRNILADKLFTISQQCAR